MNKRYLGIVILFSLALISSFVNQAQAANNCGDTNGDGLTDTVCACGDTVVGAAGYTYELPGDLTCGASNGLNVGADDITIDGSNHTITGNGNPGNKGISDSGGYDNITIQNFANITNFGPSVYFNNTSGSIIQNVTATSNTNGYGIQLVSSNDNNITGNTLNSNLYGIYLNSSTGNTVTGNTTNSNVVAGIYLVNSSTGNNITGNTTNSGMGTCTGIYLSSSTGNIVTGNTASLNMYGIQFVDFSTGNTLTGNTVNSNTYGLRFFNSSTGNTLTSNVILNNQYDIYSAAGITNNFSSNQFSNNITGEMVTFVETTRTINVGKTATSSITAYDPNGTDCKGCASVTLSPPESSLVASTTDNQTDISFTPTQTGIYSLNFTVTDANANVTKRRIIFLVGATSTRTVTQYFRGNVPTHGQPKGNGHDVARLLLTVPTSTETWYCTTYIDNFCDEIPDYPLVNLLDISQYIWYKQTAESGAFMGIKRFGLYDIDVDYSNSVDAATHYTWINNNFTDLDLNWAMDYPQSWYWLAFKFMAGGGGNPYEVTFPATEADADPASWAAHHHPDGTTDASYADFTYEYTTTPAIKSVSDENIIVLSATADPSDTGIISIVLEDVLTSDISTMDIVLSSPVRIDLSFDAWNTTAPYYKQWTEEASELGIIATHTLNGFAPNNYYMVTKDGALIGLYLSDASGQITFTAIAGSVFTVSGVDTVFDMKDDGGGGGHCFIATATYGTPMAEEVKIFSQFRDECLLTNPIGKIFVNTYYKTSPPIADFIKEHPILKKVVRITLNPLVWMSEKLIE